MAVPTLMILDDDRAFVEAVSILLSDEGYQTVQAFSGEEALASFRGNGIDLAIIDVNLPDISGLEVMTKLLETPVPPPVIIISSDHRAELQEQALAAGARLFLPKPLMPDELLASIAAALGEPR
jgi:DNA-binding response OmpR family regulator